MNSISVNIHTCLYMFLLDLYLGMKLLYQDIYISSVLVDTAKYFFKLFVPFTLLSAVHESSSVLHPANTQYFVFLILANLVVVFHVNLRFYNC